jgi:hypothetical protein
MADYEKQTFAIDWDGIAVSVVYAPDWLNMSKRGVASAHLEITAIKPARAPLPISETGYRSLFTQAETIEAAGGAATYVLAWLNEAARDPAWIKYKAQSAQLELF